jgi:hydroxylamine reductase
VQHNNFNNFEYDECSARGACSVPPSLSAIQEVLRVALKECAFYIGKLKSADIDTIEAEKIIIGIIANTVSTTAYPEEQVLGLIKASYATLTNIREMYLENLGEQGSDDIDTPEILRLTPDLNLNDILLLGEKFIQQRNKNIISERKNYIDLIIILIINLSVKFSQLCEYDILDKLSAEKIIDALNILNRTQISLSKYENILTDLALLDQNLKHKLYLIYKEKFGEISNNKVSHSTDKGKAILVSGSSLYDLKLLLDAAKETDIDIYTHDDLIIAHAFAAFTEYKNLKGHFGTCNEKCILDFATFPGAILLTENSNINTEYLYRGRLFTTSNIIPRGIVGIKNHDYAPLINSATEAKGFAKGQLKNNSFIGFNQKILIENLNEITSKFNTGEIIRLIIDIGEDNTNNIKRIKKILSDNDFLIEFSPNIDDKNSLHINISNNIPLRNEILRHILNKINISSENLFFVYAKSNISDVPDLINLKKSGAKNVLVGQFLPNIINPQLQKFLQKFYGIKLLTTPEKDFEI